MAWWEVYIYIYIYMSACYWCALGCHDKDDCYKGYGGKDNIQDKWAEKQSSGCGCFAMIV